MSEETGESLASLSSDYCSNDDYVPTIVVVQPQEFDNCQQTIASNCVEDIAATDQKENDFRYIVLLNSKCFEQWHRLRAEKNIADDITFASYLLNLAEGDAGVSNSKSGPHKETKLPLKLSNFVTKSRSEQSSADTPCAMGRTSTLPEEDLTLEFSNELQDNVNVAKQSLPSNDKCQSCKVVHTFGECKRTCGLCFKIFASPCSLKRHMKETHLPTEIRKKSQCQYCERDFLTKSAQKCHEQEEHEMEQQFLCPSCPKTFTRDVHLKNHIRVMHTVRNFWCHHCGKTLASKERLDLHYDRTHSEEALQRCVHICDKCGKRFNERRKLTLHLQAVHSTESATCELCGKVCKSRYSLWYHRYYRHSETVKNRGNNKCEHCGKVYQTVAGLNRHVNVTHEGIRLQCDKCHRVFTTKYMVEVHVAKEHGIGVKPEACPHCERVFCHEFLLKKHIRSAHTSASEACPACHKIFKTRWALRKHQEMIHQGLRVYQCQRCSSSYGYVHHLERHMKQAHGVESMSIITVV